MSELAGWLPGMYVPLEDFEDDYDLALVEDWMRGVDDEFVGIRSDEDCIKNNLLSGCFDYGWSESKTSATRITPDEALEIVRNSREVK